MLDEYKRLVSAREKAEEERAEALEVRAAINPPVITAFTASTSFTR